MLGFSVLTMSQMGRDEIMRRFLTSEINASEAVRLMEAADR
jgi:hypothetical protein